MDEEKLINLVQRYPFVYDKNDNNYTNAILRENAWEEISKLMGNGVTAYNCKQKWRNLRECYRKAMAQRERLCKGGKNTKPWKFQQELAYIVPFLAPVVESPSSINPMPASQQSSDENQSDDLDNEPLQKPNILNVNQNSSINQHNEYNTSRKKFKNNDPPTAASVLSQYLEKTQLTSAFPSDALTTFFLSMAETVKKLPPDLQIQAKKDVFNAITDCEIIAMNRRDSGNVMMSEFSDGHGRHFSSTYSEQNPENIVSKHSQ